MKPPLFCQTKAKSNEDNVNKVNKKNKKSKQPKTTAHLSLRSDIGRKAQAFSDFKRDDSMMSSDRDQKLSALIKNMIGSMNISEEE